MAAADDIRDFLVTDLASFLPSLTQSGAAYVYAGQRFDYQHHGNNQHVLVKWIESPDGNRAEKDKKHEYQILVAVHGDDKPADGNKSAQSRSYVEAIIARYDAQPSRFRSGVSGLICYRARCFQDDSIDIEEGERLSRRTVGLSLEVNTKE